MAFARHDRTPMPLRLVVLCWLLCAATAAGQPLTWREAAGPYGGTVQAAVEGPDGALWAGLYL